MKIFRTMVVLLSASCFTSSAFAFNCTGVPVWNFNSSYTKDSIVQIENNAYKANWWSQNNNPATHSGPWQEWTLLGGCNSPSSISKSSVVTVSSKSVSSSSIVSSSAKSSSVKSSSLTSSSLPKSSVGSSAISSSSFSSASSSVVLWKSVQLTGAVFTTGIEGPAVDANGNLYVANFNHDGSIGKIAAGATAPTVLVDLPVGSISSGIRFDANNIMIATDYVNHNLFKIDLITKKVTVFSHNNSMNQPNDLTIMANGFIFASDPDWSKDSGQLWRIDTNGTTTLLASGMGTTNGIEISPDNKILYVNESVQRTIWKFDVDASGNISNKRVFKQFTDAGLDGMRADPSGNLYVARYGAGKVIVISPTGVILREVSLLGVNPTNVTFSKDYKKCFVTLQDKRWVEVFNIQ